MTEGPSPAPSAALAAWLASPADGARLAAMAAASPIPAQTIERLPAAGLAALQRSEGLRLVDLRPAVRMALLIAGLRERLGIVDDSEERRLVEQQPFTLHIAGGEIVAEIAGAAERRRGIGEPCFHQWAAGVTATAIVIDCHRVEHVNSVLIAWMLQVVQAAKPVPVHIRRARAQVVAQLRQLRLDHLMKIV